MKPAISFATALADPALLGAAFQGASFRPWHTVARVISGEALDATDAALFRRCTGRRRLPRGPVNRLYLATGRRGGKSKFLSSLGVWATCLAYDWRDFASAGETMVTALIGADRKQAAILARYALGFARASPLIASQITREAEDRLEFANGGALEVMTNDARLIRGRSMVALLGDEVCFWKTDDEAASSDEEVWSAATPSLATAPGGGWAVLSSSPSRPKGLLHRKWKALHGVDGAEIAWQAPSRVMNPTLPEAIVRQAFAEDPVRAKSEFGAEWRQAGDDFVPLEALLAVTDHGVKERAPVAGRRYVAFVDGAGGTGKDSFVTALAHREPDGTTAVLDLILERRPRFVPAQVAAEHAAVMKLFGVHECRGDPYSAGWIKDEFARHGITYRLSTRTTSENYLAGLPMILASRARLLDSQRLRDQLTGLVRRVHSQGRESVDHSGSSKTHDDVAAACMGAIVLAGTRTAFEELFDRALAAPILVRREHRAAYDDDFSIGRPIDSSRMEAF